LVPSVSLFLAVKVLTTSLAAASTCLSRSFAAAASVGPFGLPPTYRFALFFLGAVLEEVSKESLEALSVA
jgi:hypothetical protein